MSEQHRGSCNCGKVSYQIDGKLNQIIGCHCSQCRKQTGLYYAATGALRSETTISGSENLTWYTASDFAKRGFCKTCGSALFWQHNTSKYISILAGSLDTPTDIKFKAHIFCDDKADYYDIPDDIPSHPQDIPS